MYMLYSTKLPDSVRDTRTPHRQFEGEYHQLSLLPNLAGVDPGMPATTSDMLYYQSMLQA
jgi:hypothetical protein